MIVYILQSARTGRYYIGSTENLERRLWEHNQPERNPSRWTRGSGPWELLFSAELGSATEALRAEKLIKRMKSRKFVEKLVRRERKLGALGAGSKRPRQRG